MLLEALVSRLASLPGVTVLVSVPGAEVCDGTLESAGGDGLVMSAPIDRILRFFAYSHLPKHLQEVSRACHDLAHKMAQELPASAELTVGLRKLLEAKDAFVRAALDDSTPRPGETNGP